MKRAFIRDLIEVCRNLEAEATIKCEEGIVSMSVPSIGGSELFYFKLKHKIPELEDGIYTVNLKELHKATKSAKGEVTLSNNEGFLLIKSNKRKASLPLINEEKYSPLPSFTGNTTVKIDIKEYLSAFSDISSISDFPVFVFKDNKLHLEALQKGKIKLEVSLLFNNEYNGRGQFNSSAVDNFLKGISKVTDDINMTISDQSERIETPLIFEGEDEALEFKYYLAPMVDNE